MGVEVVPPDVNRSRRRLRRVRTARFCSASARSKAAAAARRRRSLRRAKPAGRSPACSISASASIRKPAAGRRSKRSSRPAHSIRSAAQRSQLMAAIDRAMQCGAAVLADRRSGQRGLFEDGRRGLARRRQSPPARHARVRRERTARHGKGSARLLPVEPPARRARSDAAHVLHAHELAAREARSAHRSARRRHAGRDQVFAHEEPAPRQHEHQVRHVGPGRSRRHRALHPLAGAVRRVRPAGEGRRDPRACGPASTAARAATK